MDLNAFRMDKKAEDGGVWVDLDDTTSVCVARYNNRRFGEVLNRLRGPHRQSIKAKTLSDEVAERILIQAMAEAILLEWRGVTEDGVSVEPTLENRVRILTAYRDFRDIIAEISMDAANYRATAIEADAQD